MNRLARVALIPLLLAVLVACGSLGLLTPQTFNERWASAIGQTTAARETATMLLNEQAIDSRDAENVLQQTDVARQGLDIAFTIHKTDSAGGDARLKATVIGLTAIKEYLATKKPKEAPPQ